MARVAYLADYRWCHLQRARQRGIILQFKVFQHTIKEIVGVVVRLHSPLLGFVENVIKAFQCTLNIAFQPLIPMVCRSQTCLFQRLSTSRAPCMHVALRVVPRWMHSVGPALVARWWVSSGRTTPVQQSYNGCSCHLLTHAGTLATTMANRWETTMTRKPSLTMQKVLAEIVLQGSEVHPDGGCY